MLYPASIESISRLPAGNQGQTLVIQGDGSPAWQAAPSGFADPMLDPGDIIVRNAANVTTRLPLGVPGQALVAGNNSVFWTNVTAGAGGPEESIQLNISGAIQGLPDLTFDTNTNTLNTNNISITGDFVVGLWVL